MSLRVQITVDAAGDGGSQTETRVFNVAITPGTREYYEAHLAGLAEAAIRECLRRVFVEESDEGGT